MTYEGERILVTPFVYDWCGLRDRGEDGRPRLDEWFSVPKCLDWCPHHLFWRVNYPVSWNVKLWGDRFHTWSNILWNRQKCFTDKKLEDGWGWKDWFLYSNPSRLVTDRLLQTSIVTHHVLPASLSEERTHSESRGGEDGCSVLTAVYFLPLQECRGKTAAVEAPQPVPDQSQQRSGPSAAASFVCLFFLASYINKKLLITGKQRHRRLLTWQPVFFSSVISRHLILTFPSSLKSLEYSPPSPPLQARIIPALCWHKSRNG